jgi:hypothetical protein
MSSNLKFIPKENKKLKKFNKRNDLLSDKTEYSIQDVADSLPDFKNFYGSDEKRKIQFYNNELFKGYKFPKKERISNPFLGEPSYGTTYETNLPEQAFTFEYPSLENTTFNPLQMHLTGKANFDRLKRGGTLPITPLPENFSPNAFIRQKVKNRYI